ncbi:hypothetical protein PG991_001862 [Apiospora marii]|uniref:Protein kinase domain-containing protein n=1 Tax=Apiospora marii TaxID=335849 RepID=A0ABR1SNB2_9PEZI
MTHRLNEVYTVNGIYLPWGPDDHVPRLTTGNPTERLKEKGFIFVDILRPGVAVVQSIENGQLYVNELVTIGLDTLFNAPPSFRVSSFNPGQYPNIQPPPRLFPDYVLPDEPYFPKVALAEEQPNPMTNTNTWSVYYKHPNGGTLQNLIELHNRSRRPVPPPFIWHVMEQLAEALHYMYRGRGRYNTPAPPATGPYPWVPLYLPHRRVYHRNLTPANIYLDYEPRGGGGGPPAAGQIRNAFPVIRIGGWDDSAIEGDGPAALTRGRFNQGLNEWEDALGYGQIIRSLMMAHIPLWDPNTNPCPNQNVVLNEYNNPWTHRPDSRDITALSQLPGAPYEAVQYSLVEPFEVDNIQQQGNAAIIPGGNVGAAGTPMRGTTTQFQGCRQIGAHPQTGQPMFAADINYIVNHVRRLATAAMTVERRPNQPRGYYTAHDVSWTKPKLLPYTLPQGIDRYGLQRSNPAPLLPPAIANGLNSLVGGPMALRPNARVKVLNMNYAKEPPA